MPATVDVKMSVSKSKTTKRAVVNSDTGPTPPGYNKNLRFKARLALAASSCALLLSWPTLALVCGIAAAWLLHQGTAFSVKNFKWRALSWLTVPACLAALAARNAALQIDQDKAYTVYLLVSLFGRGVEFTTGAFVAVVIAFAWTSPEQTKAE